MPELCPSWQFPRARLDARRDSDGTHSPLRLAHFSGVSPLIHRSSSLGGRDPSADLHALEPDGGTVGPRYRWRPRTGQSGEVRIGDASRDIS